MPVSRKSPLPLFCVSCRATAAAAGTTTTTQTKSPTRLHLLHWYALCVCVRVYGRRAIRRLCACVCMHVCVYFGGGHCPWVFLGGLANGSYTSHLLCQSLIWTFERQFAHVTSHYTVTLRSLALALAWLISASSSSKLIFHKFLPLSNSLQHSTAHPHLLPLFILILFLVIVPSGDSDYRNP